jgi:hypothetical protein
MKNKFEVGVDSLGRVQPSDGLRNRKRRAVREVNRYRMSEMTDAAMLIFELAVPVSGSLKSERQNERGHYNSHDPVRYLTPLKQPNTPTPMLLRRRSRCNRDDKFCYLPANP